MHDLLQKNSLIDLKTILRIVPVGRITWLNGVKKGYFPQPIRIGPRRIFWKSEDIDSLVKNGTFHNKKDN